MKVKVKVKHSDAAVAALKSAGEQNVRAGIPHPYGYCDIFSDNTTGRVLDVLKPFAWSKTIQGEINFVE